MLRTYLSLVLVGFALIGCQREEPIVRHVVPKDRSGLDHLRDQRDPKSEQVNQVATAATEEDRMVVAMALRDDATWFFKLTGPVSRVKELEPQWRPFLESVSFDDSGKPKWQLPDRWKSSGPRPMRFATLVVDEKKPPIEIAVSSLSAGQDVLLNVNRWRGQLGLKPTTKEQLNDQLATIQAGTEKLTVFDETGKASGSMMPPFAGAGGRRVAQPMRAGNNTAASTGTPTKSIDFIAPDGWERGKPSPFLQARLTKAEGEQTVQISVSSLPAAANKWEPNVKRWAGQLGMDPMDVDQLAKATKPVTVDGMQGQQVRLIPDEGSGDAATVAVMIKKDAAAWFFKLTGDRTLVLDSEKAFSKFLETVTLP